ncbi:MAG: 50S ribosomal protein L28 [Bacteroidales bacterium]|jgi:large subunit ribosomal protein L28|nr:50S ribosomal protein L28 [Bacteroidales bacterium]
MARVCEITGKKTIVGNRVSHSNIKTKRKFKPNLHTKKFWVEELQDYVYLKVSAKGIKYINKKGVLNAMRDAYEKGYLK